MHPKHMEDKTRKDQLQAVWFAAGMAVVIACLERAVVLSIFRQWHVWVFLALNLLLIAILFTSTHPPPDPSNPPPKSHPTQETDGKSKGQPPEASDHHEDVGDNGVNGLKASNQVDSNFEEENEEEEEDDDDDEKSSTLLSNEELNERVEAFISRFRQQYLVSDVKISRSRSDNVCGVGGVFSKTITV